MIAHRIPKSSGKDSFTKLGCYVLDLASPLDPKGFERLASYVVDREGDRGERVVGARVTNCADEDFALAMKEIADTQAGNRRSKSDKSYHLVISFPEGERPTLDQLRDIEDRLVEAIGYADHQRISAIHDDTDNLHIHVAINKVHPTTFRNVEPYFDKRTLMVTCRELEVKHGLMRDNHGLTVEQEQKIEARAADRPIDRRPDISDQGRDGRPDADRAREMEIYSSKESLAGWIEREAKDDLLAVVAGATSWEQVHDGFREYGLAVKPHGAGLVIGIEGGPWVKASSVDRSLSHGKLTGKLGAFVPAKTSQERTADAVIENVQDAAVEGQASTDVQERVRDDRGLSETAKTTTPTPAKTVDRQEPQPKQYRQTPVQRSPISKALYARFERERESAEAARAAAMIELRENFASRAAYEEKLWKAERAKLNITRGMERVHKQRLREQIIQQAQRGRVTRNSEYASARAEARKNYPMPTWQRFLEREAARGDEAAISVLRERIINQGGTDKDVLTAKDLTEARNVVYQNLNPTVAANGDVRYVVRDGGVVTDRKTVVRADKTSAASAFLALSLAQDRFGNQPLVIDGSDAFKATVIEVAALQGMNVTFADPQLEKARQIAAAQMAAESPAIDPRQPKEGALGYIEQRNGLRGVVTDIPPHRLWTPADAGAAEYAGRRRFGDGTEAVLLKDSRGIAVMPVTWRQAAKASRWTPGQLVLTDERGRFVSSQMQDQSRKQEHTRQDRGQGRGR